MNTGDAPLVSIIIVTYDSSAELPACLDSIVTQDIRCEVFVVDNNSTDGTQQLIESLSGEFPMLTAILNSVNKGLANANNQAMYRCAGKYVLILNPDTVLLPGAIASLVDYLDAHDDVGVVGPKNLSEDGSPHVSFENRWSVLHIILRKFAVPSIKHLWNRLSEYEESTVAYVSGACLMIRRELFVALGGYDGRYFLAAEDAADLCLRARHQGFRTVFYPEAQVMHLAGRSHEGLRFLATYHSCDGSLYYVRQHEGELQFVLLFVSIFLIFLLKALYSRLLSPLFPARYEGVSEVYTQVLRALVDGCFGANGDTEIVRRMGDRVD